MVEVSTRPGTDMVDTRRVGGSPRGAPRRVLLVIADDQVSAHPLPLAGEITVGRGSWCTVSIDHPSLSRSHLSLVLGATIAVVDRGSANGTRVRDARVEPGAMIEIASNDTVHAGDLALVVQEVGGLAPLPPARTAQARSSGEIAAPRSGPILLDPAMQRLYDVAARVARGTIGVLVTGETGAGKEVLADFVHRSSPRAGRPLLRINCAALTDSVVESELFGHERGAFTGALRERTGLIEAADGGTVMLDEVGELSLPTQAKLLRVVEDRQVLRVGSSTPRAVDVRFIAATNRDLEANVAAHAFRRDLYFRLAGVVLEVPPLRQRPVEIEALARTFLADASRRLGQPPPALTSDAIAALQAHPWPGNVRELRNVIDRAALMGHGEAIDVTDLGLCEAPPQPLPASAVVEPAPSIDGDRLSDQVAELERRRILDALDGCAGNQSRAAKLLGMPRRTLLRRLAKYGIQRPRRG